MNLARIVGKLLQCSYLHGSNAIGISSIGKPVSRTTWIRLISKYLFGWVKFIGYWFISLTLTPNMKFEPAPVWIIVSVGYYSFETSLVKLIVFLESVCVILLAKLTIITTKIPIDMSPPVKVFTLLPKLIFDDSLNIEGALKNRKYLAF